MSVTFAALDLILRFIESKIKTWFRLFELKGRRI